MAMKYHPDRNPDDQKAEEKFKEAAEAYEILSDDNKRARYDQFGHAGVRGAAGGPGGGGYQDISDIFGDIFGSGSPFGDFFGGGGGTRRRGRTRRGQPGSDLRISLSLSLEEIASGVEKKLKIKRYVSCDACSGNGSAKGSSHKQCHTCHGSGEVRREAGSAFFRQVVIDTCPTCRGEGRIISQACAKCQGKGRLLIEDTVKFKVPPGVMGGNKLRLDRKGHAGIRGGEAGDLIIIIEEQGHEFFERNGDHLIYEHFLSFPEASLGTQVEVPTVDGNKVRFKVSPGTLPGKVVRLKGKGLPNINGYKTGDLLVQLNIWTPKKLSSEEKKILEKLSKSPNFQPGKSQGDSGFFARMKEFFN